MVRGVLGTGDDVVPSSDRRVSFMMNGRGRERGRGGSYSRIFESEGCAVMYGGGFSEMLLYSRVNCDQSGWLACTPFRKDCRWGVVEHVRASAPHGWPCLGSWLVSEVRVAV